jgi:hypothetical protein
MLGPVTRGRRSSSVEEIAPGVHAVRLRFAWVHLLEASEPGDGPTLVDCGLPGGAGRSSGRWRRSAGGSTTSRGSSARTLTPTTPAPPASWPPGACPS